MNEKKELALKISEKWNKQFERAKGQYLSNLRDYYFYRLAIMYELICYMNEQGADRLGLDTLKWLYKYIDLEQAYEWCCDRDENMWEEIEGALYDNYRWSKDYGERRD